MASVGSADAGTSVVDGNVVGVVGRFGVASVGTGTKVADGIRVWLTDAIEVAIGATWPLVPEPVDPQDATSRASRASTDGSAQPIRFVCERPVPRTDVVRRVRRLPKVNRAP